MSIPISFTLENDELHLRIIKKEDIPFMFSATRFDDFNDGMVWNKPETIDELYESFPNSIEKWTKGIGYSFLIMSKESSPQQIGRISIRKSDNQEVWNVGFWTHPEKQSRGYMSSALNLILEFGFSLLNAQKIFAEYAKWNIASEKVLTKNGFVNISSNSKGFKKNGKWIEENKMMITIESWQNSINKI